MMNWVINNWLVLLVIVYLVGMMLYGHYRGFFKIAVSAIALILTIMLVNVMLPYATGFIRNNTNIDNTIQNAMLNSIGFDYEDSNASESTTDQEILILNLDLPNEVKEMLIDNNNENMWQNLGVDKFAEYIGSFLGNIIINVVGFVILFIIIWLLLHILISFADIFTKLPVLHGLNQIAGAVVGFVEGLIFVWIGCIVISAFAGGHWGSQIYAMIKSSILLSFIFNHNLLSIFLKSLIYSMF